MAVLARRASDVYVAERDASTMITTSSTAAAAQVVVSSQGPSSKPRRYTNPNDYIRDFGTPNPRVSFDHFCALKFFEDGNDLWAMRAVGVGAKYSAIVVKRNTSGRTVAVPVVGGVTDPDIPDWDNLVEAGEEPYFLLYAKRGQGSYGDSFAVAIESSNLDRPENLEGEAVPVGGGMGDGSYEYVVAAVSQSGESLASASTTVVIAGSTGTARVDLSWEHVEGASGYHIYRRARLNQTSPTTVWASLGRIGAARPAFTDTGWAAPNVNQQAITSPGQQGAPDTSFTIRIYDDNVSLSNPVETMVVSIDDRIDETGTQQELESKLNPFSEYLSAKSNRAQLFTTPIVKSVPKTYLAGGTSGAAPTSADINACWSKFLDKEQYTVDVLINAGRTSLTVQKHMDYVAGLSGRGDCVAYLDLPPTVQSFQEAIDYRRIELNLNSSFSALFGPDIRVADPISGNVVFTPPSGAAAGLYARTARRNAPWFSIAGLNRGLINCIDIRHSYDNGQSTALVQAQISYIKKRLGQGIALWEQFTLSEQASAMQFLNVRHLLNIVKRSLYDSLLYAMQEPNDEILRRQTKFRIEQFLTTIVEQRGLQRFTVDIGNTLNSAAYVNSGILKIAVVLLPILAIREIQLSLIVSKAGIELSESEISAMAA